jgi:hypothetical protein
MAGDPDGEWLRAEIAELSEGEVWDVVRAFRVDGHLIELLHSPDAGYALVGYEADGKARLLGNPDDCLRTAVRTSLWSKLRTWD